MTTLNQVLLRDEIQVGADLPAWLAHGGGTGLATQLHVCNAVIAVLDRTLPRQS